MNSPFPKLSRRQFISTAGFGLGAAAFSSLAQADEQRGRSKTGSGVSPESFRMIAPKAKSVIFLCMAGGPSHLETFDYKPELTRLTGEPMPESFTKGQPIAQLQGQELKCMGPIIPFQRHGKSGQMISDYLPHTAEIADDIAIIRSMVTEQINHDPAHTFMNTGTAISGRPSMGAWVNYGLGSENQNLPGFVVLTSEGGRNPQPISSRQWDCGFLPGRYSGVEFSATGSAVNYLSNPNGMSKEQQRETIDTIKQLNQLRNEEVLNPDIDTRISAYELAFRMQTSVPELLDVSDEPLKTLEMYGAAPGDGSFASNCLLARRMVERGVRFVHLYHRGWDHHGGLEKYMPICCGLTDMASAALVMDLKQRGLLDETLVIWGGEFGRTPMIQEKGGAGRDHHIKGFSMWMAGGGIKGGVTHGETDELGYNAVKDVVHVRDLHATMLHLLGIDATRFVVKHQGLDMKLTGVEEPHVIQNIIG